MRHGAAGRRSRNRGHGGGHSHNNQGHNHRRGGNGGGTHNRMHVFDSNGPEVRIRGTAHQICEKYQMLAKDAASQGNRVLSESYLQHAEHYQRVINSWVTEAASAPDAHSLAPPVVETTQAVASGVDLGLPESIIGARTVVQQELADA